MATICSRSSISTLTILKCGYQYIPGEPQSISVQNRPLVSTNNPINRPQTEQEHDAGVDDASLSEPELE
jgi:hypothetical protein